MKFAAVGIALLLLGSAAAEAGIFSKQERLPKPIDHPIIRPKMRDDHKAGKRLGRHPSELLRPEWGGNWAQLLTIKRPHPIPGYLKQVE